jgi:glyoxylase-like metal-dependent hydrolase (beta-lactamase superfamily II)
LNPQYAVLLFILVDKEVRPMTTRALSCLVIALLLPGGMAAAGDTVNGLPLHIEKLSDNAIRLWVGDFISSTAVSALNTEKGIVVIDATESPVLDQKFRKIIAREFGRDDFLYLINTHEHADHTNGNGVYSDCEIIAHENCAAGMRARRADSQRIIDWYKTRLPELESELAQTEKGSEDYRKTREDLIVKKMTLDSLESGVPLTFPTRTFSDSMKLDMGNMTLELYYMGGTHTASDIFVLVPEEGLLFTGDMMADIWLTDTPGCLQAFAIRQGVERNMPLLLEHWKELIGRKDEIKDYIPAHWNGDLTYEGFVARYNYVDTLYSGIKKAATDGQKLESLFSEFSMESRFPDLAGTPGFTQDWVHNGSVIALWSDATGAESASNALAAAIEEKGAKAAVQELTAARAAGSDRYYFLEGEFNRLGYGYLGEEKYEEAIAVFAMNVEMYPESWNVYDSLGEAYMKSGKYDLAVRNYERSLALNPENENGQRMLDELHTAIARK